MVKKRLKTNRHKKLKAVDPFYVGERKLLLDKGLINANQAPKQSNNDDDKIPSKLKEYIDLKHKYDKSKKEVLNEIKKGKQAINKSSKKKPKIKSKAQLEKIVSKRVFTREADDTGAEVPVRPSLKLERNDGESDARYLNRVENQVQNVIRRSQYETQFDVQIESKDGKVVVKKEKKMSEKKRRRLNKLKEKIKSKKQDKKLDAANKSFKSEVKFGEVVHAPPSITAFPKVREKKVTYTIPPNSNNKHGITEHDRNQVIERYRIMKMQGKFK